MKEGKSEILIELAIFPIQLACLAASLFSRRAGVEAGIINFSLFIMTLLTDAVLLRLRRIKCCRAELKERLAEFEFFEEMNEKYILAEKKRQEDSEELRKRLRKRLDAARQAINAMERGEGQGCIKTLYKRGERDRGIRSGNSLLDVILCEKSEACKCEKIDFQTEVFVPAKMQITDYHLCCIFNNLLDNAMEAAGILSDVGRKVSAAANTQGDYLCIRITNGCAAEYLNRPEREGHGLGKKIVELIVKDYDGDFSTDYRNDEFVADVVMRWKKDQ